MDINKIIEQHLNVSQSLYDLETDINEICKVCFECISRGNKILLCGNGGSAADSIHIAAELVGKFETHRKSLPAIALSSNISNITSIGNDFGFDQIFSRQISSLGEKDDVLIALSTSGNSENIIKAIESARENKMRLIVFTGGNGGVIAKNDDALVLKINSDNTARIQEMHILVGHIICKYIDNYFQ